MGVSICRVRLCGSFLCIIERFAKQMIPHRASDNSSALVSVIIVGNNTVWMVCMADSLAG